MGIYFEITDKDVNDITLLRYTAIETSIVQSYYDIYTRIWYEQILRITYINIYVPMGATSRSFSV